MSAQPPRFHANLPPDAAMSPLLEPSRPHGATRAAQWQCIAGGLATAAGDDSLAARLGIECARNTTHYGGDLNLPQRNLARLHELGLLALTAPEAAGGCAALPALALEIVRAVARGHAATALVLASQYLFFITANGLERWRSPLRAALFDAVRAGALVDVLRPSPLPGHHAGNVRCEATADGWRLHGSALHCTGRPLLGWLAVRARGTGQAAHDSLWLFPADTPGVRFSPADSAAGMRASAHCLVELDGVALHHDHRYLPTAGSASEVRAWTHALVAALHDGIAQHARDHLLRQPARHDAAIAEMNGNLQANRGLLDQLAGLPADSAVLQATIARNAAAVVTLALAHDDGPTLRRCWQDLRWGAAGTLAATPLLHDALPGERQ